MSPFRRSLSSKLDDATVDALLAGQAVPGEQAVGDVLAVLRSSVERVEPSTALAAMLVAGVTPASPAVARRRRRAVRSVVAIAAVSTSLLGAASANALPGPLQRVISGVVETVTPLELPGPLEGDEAPVLPVAPPEVTVPGAGDVLTGDESGEQGSRSELDGADDQGNEPDSDSSNGGGPESDGPESDGPESDGPDPGASADSGRSDGRPGEEKAETEGPAVDEPDSSDGGGAADPSAEGADTSTDGAAADPSADTADPIRADNGDQAAGEPAP